MIETGRIGGRVRCSCSTSSVAVLDFIAEARSLGNRKLACVLRLTDTMPDGVEQLQVGHLNLVSCWPQVDKPTERSAALVGREWANAVRWGYAV
jgi:hypothetical protein